MIFPKQTNRLIFVITALFFLYPDIYAQHKKIIAQYENNSTILNFYDENSYLILAKDMDIRPLIGCGDDTLSYGKYLKYKKHYYLYSDTIFERPYLPCTINILDTFPNDSLTVIVQAPFFQQQKRNSELKNAYYYVSSITLKNNLYWSEPIILNISFKDTIYFSKKELEGATTIDFYIYPFKSCSRTNPYYQRLEVRIPINNIHSGVIQVTIPKFTAMYLYYSRCDAMSVEIINKYCISFGRTRLLYNTLKRKKWKFNKEWKYIVNKRRDPYFDESGDNCR